MSVAYFLKSEKTFSGFREGLGIYLYNNQEIASFANSAQLKANCGKGLSWPGDREDNSSIFAAGPPTLCYKCHTQHSQKGPCSPG